MHISLTTPMSDDKERQRQNAAMIDAIEQYTEERMNDEYGRIHTDGSRSGGQPLHSDVERVARALAQVDGVEICSDATYALSSYGHKAQAALAAMRQPTQSKVAAACTDRIGGAGVVPHGVVGVATQSDALRDLVATLWCASGCSCCRDDDAWEKASHELAELLGIPKYDDGSGYDWYSVCDAAKGQSK